MRIRQEIQTVPRQAELAVGATRIHVVAGILRGPNRQVLITDRLRSSSMRDLWEFPGGKVESGESAVGALHRELAEELGIESLEIEHFKRIEHDYPDLLVSIDFFMVSAWQGTPTGMEGQQLRWVDVDSLDSGLLLPADAPVVESLCNTLKISKC